MRLIVCVNNLKMILRRLNPLNGTPRPNMCEIVLK
jgi:hypothetical protein